ncbi:alpha/beta hydrolase [Stakelama sp. CBK3Z-3]|uniref:Alpha/beta hydrolase n=1 Tax=Stakelama flava TaxID=2860338 RepID=A0ABS6XKV3_9SPHN|nr:alpha/beta hydrolase [Stakelama flava]MBW4330832.1 alpha/beta hydrolase [Stakelama flava]
MNEPFVRPDVRSFLGFVANVPAPRMHELEPPAAREQYRAMRDIADLPVGDLAVIKDLSISGPAGNIAARLFDARADRLPGPAVVFFHGGGFVIGDLDTHAPACAEMARILDFPVIAVDYRLAPEHPWPAAPDDCEAAARWVAGSPAELGRAVTSLVLSGDSAGGALTIVTAMALRDTPANVPVIAQFPIYPAADTKNEYPSFKQFAEGYLLDRAAMKWFDAAYRADSSNWRASPMQGNVAGLPPALVLTAGLDPLRDQGRAYAAALIQAGIAVSYREAKGNIHGFITIRKAIPSSQGDYNSALAVLKDIVAEAEAERVMAQAAS